MFTGSSKNLTLVAALFNPYNYRGYCTAFLDSKPVDRKQRIMRNSVKIFFDTNIKADQCYARPCKNIDEDPFNKCEPVNCDVRYNGRKPYFDNNIKRCVNVPECISKDNQYLPDITYDPRTNKCSKENIIKEDDFSYIKSLLQENRRVPKDIVIVKKSRPSRPENSKNAIVTNFLNVNNEEGDITTDIFDRVENERSDKLSKNFLRNKIYDTTFPELMQMETSLFSTTGNRTKPGLVWYMPENLNTILFLIAITAFQFCLLGCLIYFVSFKVLCRCKKKLERHYFNYRQDASVTTPLIGTSNIETDTTCQFMSESSNIDKKIQCYKSCQREQAKISLSDDILSKCLNRRKWELNQTKSHNICPAFPPLNESTDVKRGVMKVSEYQQYSVYANNAIEQKANYKNEKVKVKKSAKSKSSKFLKKSESLHKSENKSGDLRKYTDSDIVSSERILKCHSFNYMGEDPQSDFTKACTSNCFCDNKCGSTQTSLDWSHAPDNESTHEKVTGFEPDTQNCDVFTCAKVKLDDKSHSSEKGAQASFTNDSLDDFLSERGMIFLAGEDISKYSMESDPVSLSSVSSKTSKNNVLRNVLSLFRKKSKQRVSSEPGLEKSKESIDLELIHMSRPTIYSSSNVDSEVMNTIAKKIKDSRSSL